ncbi:hypothetical protein PV325_001741 [Microctonus aethiopoides]|nr:hypothetical protein PV325_001741 [Microctonus aethiopoides]
MTSRIRGRENPLPAHTVVKSTGRTQAKIKGQGAVQVKTNLNVGNVTREVVETWKMLTCVYPSESFKTKAVTVKLRHGGKSKKKTILLGIKERPGIAKPDISPPVSRNEVS